MAVYTHVSAERISALLGQYDIGTLISAKGIAEGVENSNYLIETTEDRFILTLYEKRVDTNDLPYFLSLLDHLAERGQPVPPAIADNKGKQLQTLMGKQACLIAFLPGVSPSKPTAAQAQSAGQALGELHDALQTFEGNRDNELSLRGWHALANRCGDALNDIAPDLHERVTEELAFLDEQWPDDLEHSAIHADLFPDNVLMLDDRVTGMIDFYFACNDIRAYDLGVTHAAWCFSTDGETFSQDCSKALIGGYAGAHPLSNAERIALPVLARGASLRFLLTRAWDWLNTPADALVTRKDPNAFLERLDFYRDNGAEIFAA